MLLSVLSCIGSISAPDKKLLSKLRPRHALQCIAAGPHNAIPANSLCVGSVCGLGPDKVGIHSISLAAGIELRRVQTRSTKDLRRSRQPERLILLIPALSSNWEKDFLAPSMARSTADAFNIVCRLDHQG